MAGKFRSPNGKERKIEVSFSVSCSHEDRQRVYDLSVAARVSRSALVREAIEYYLKSKEFKSRYRDLYDITH